ncbi:MAG: hypothetical protein AAF741_10570 [Bacteroidota bacterium]
MENNFKQLAAISEANFRNSGAERAVRDRLEGTLGALRMIGAVLEIYLPRMADTVVGLSGGEQSTYSQSRTNTPRLDKSGESLAPGEPENPDDLR